MSTEKINVGGDEVTVREDTAKSYRGVMWFLGTLLMILISTGELFSKNNFPEYFSMSEGLEVKLTNLTKPLMP